MTFDELKKLVANGEGVHLEFKGPKGGTDMPDARKLAQSMAAFANTEGGILLVGVKDDATIAGISAPDDVMKQLGNAARDCCHPPLYPQIGRLSLQDGQYVVWATVPPPTDIDRWYSVDERIYRRIGSSHRPLPQFDASIRAERAAFLVKRRSASEIWPLTATNTQGFQGRDRELSRLRELLRDPQTFLIAIEGIPGIGKTALAARFVADAETFGWHCFWLECHNALSFDSLRARLAAFVRAAGNQAIADLLEDPRVLLEDLLGRIATGLAECRYALFLDDYHLITDPVVTRFLQKLQDHGKLTKVFLTARKRPLRVLRSFGAAELHLEFGLDVDAATAFLTNSGIRTDSETFKQIWNLCGQGHPLALRILATRAQNLPLARLLSSLPVYREDIQQEWLTPLLDELDSEQRNLLLDISIFENPIPYSAVARSRPGTSIDSLVIGLVDRFLLAFGADELRIHPLILEYCRSLLPDRAAAHRRAAQFFLADADGSASTSDTLSDSQVEKMVSAWSHLIAAEDNVPAAALVEKLRRPLFNSARYGQLMRLLQETKPTTPRQTIRFALDKARVLAVWGDVDEAMKLVGSAQQSADPISLREVVLVSVFVHLSARMAEKALRILEEKHYMFSGEDVPVRTRMRFLSRCVEAHLQLGNGVRAYEWAAQIREICERENDTIGGAGALRQMATSLRAQKRLDLALTLATLSQDLFRENGHDGDAAISEVLVASLFVDTGKTSEALPLFENALQKLLLTGNREHIADCREHIQKLALLGTP